MIHPGQVRCLNLAPYDARKTGFSMIVPTCKAIKPCKFVGWAVQLKQLEWEDAKFCSESRCHMYEVSKSVAVLH